MPWRAWTASERELQRTAAQKQNAEEATHKAQRKEQRNSSQQPARCGPLPLPPQPWRGCLQRFGWRAATWKWSSEAAVKAEAKIFQASLQQGDGNRKGVSVSEATWKWSSEAAVKAEAKSLQASL